MNDIFSKNCKEEDQELYYPTITRAYLYEQLIKRSEIKGKILEVGCGTGIMSTLVKDYIGITKRKSEVLFGKEHNLPIVYGDMLNIPFPDEYFDCVVCIHTLEYTFKQAEAIYEMVRVTVKGGCIIIVYDCDWIIDDYFCLLLPRGLKKILEKFGCEIIEQKQLPTDDISHYIIIARK